MQTIRTKRGTLVFFSEYTWQCFDLLLANNMAHGTPKHCQSTDHRVATVTRFEVRRFDALISVGMTSYIPGFDEFSVHIYHRGPCDQH